MTDILDNELVKRYFGEGQCQRDLTMFCLAVKSSDHAGCIAPRVLRAMQEPIQKGERYLAIQDNAFWVVECCDPCSVIFHPFMLRLPDRFQQGDEVEFKIQQISQHWRGHGCDVENELRELIQLVRKTDD